ncbi:hypothetical protein [Luteimonas qiangzhengi]|uniref:hypothetical protein n=1 Tax=Luteimonas sp. MJ146 TaxID=3129240 RepID=UPI0031BB9CC5
MTVFIVLLALDFVVYYCAWFYAWSRLGRTSPEQRETLDVPSPWKNFSYELFAFTASRKFLRITDRAARRAFGLTLFLSPVPALLVLAFWLTLPS